MDGERLDAGNLAQRSGCTWSGHAERAGAIDQVHHVWTERSRGAGTDRRSSRPTRGSGVRHLLRLLAKRIVFLGSAIDDSVANLVIAQLLHLESEAPERDISLYINSPGGDMTALFAIHDTMRFVAPDVATICVGQAASAAAVLLAAGAPGKRAALPNARVLIHQPHGGAEGQSTDLERAVSEIVEMRRRMVDILVEATHQPAERLVADIDRDFILRGEDAVAYGLIDHVVERRQLSVLGAAAAEAT